tara:strand:- start:473 stop:766 length:294 start_codon:yes stop_codon:yes gene_type:complete
MSEKPISYIDTQGMGAPLSPEEKEKLKKEPQHHKPATVTPRRMLTPTEVKELKILINEVLDEREGKFDYTSYFDTQHFKHDVGEDEPQYKSKEYPVK